MKGVLELEGFGCRVVVFLDEQSRTEYGWEYYGEFTCIRRPACSRRQCGVRLLLKAHCLQYLRANYLTQKHWTNQRFFWLGHAGNSKSMSPNDPVPLTFTLTIAMTITIHVGS